MGVISYTTQGSALSWQPSPDRTIAVPAMSSGLVRGITTAQNAPLTMAQKSSGELLDFNFDLSANFPSGDVIDTVTVAAITPTGINIRAAIGTGLLASLWIDGGTVGQAYLLALTVVTVQGRARNLNATLQIPGLPSQPAVVTNVSVPQSYVDNAVAGVAAMAGQASTDAAAAREVAQAALPIAGGTMGGPIILASDPTLALGAATKQYVDQAASGPIAGAAQKAANLSDLVSAPTARANLGLGGAAILNVGTIAGTVADGGVAASAIQPGAVGVTVAGQSDMVTRDATVLSEAAAAAPGLAPVQSVAGRTGAVAIGYADVSGLGGSAVLNIGTISGTVADGGVAHTALTTATAALPAASAGPLATLLAATSSAAILAGLGYTPYNASNPSGYVTAATAPVLSVAALTGAITVAQFNNTLNLPTYTTKSSASTASIPTVITNIRTIGYTTAIDGGGAYYRRQTVQPAHNLWFQDALGAYWELNPVDGYWDVRMAGAKGDGATNDTTAIQNAVNFYRFFTGNSRARPRLVFPPGNYLFTQLTFSDIYGSGSGQNGNLIIEGSGSGNGNGNTILTCISPTGAALLSTTGNVILRGFALTSDGVNRIATSGNITAHGICFDPTQQGTVASAIDIERVLIEDVTVENQPGDGINIWNPEQIVINRVDGGNNGGNGLYTDILSSVGNVGIGCWIGNSRFYGNANEGISSKLNNSNWPNIQCLNNKAATQWNVIGVSNVIENPDCEAWALNGTTNLYGIKLSGDGNIIIGGDIYGFRTANVYISGNYAKVILPLIQNPNITSPTVGNPVYASIGIQIVAGTQGHEIQIPNFTRTGIATIVSPPNPAAGWIYNVNGVLYLGAFQEFPGSSNVPTLIGGVTMELTNDATLTIRAMISTGAIKTFVAPLS